MRMSHFQTAWCLRPTLNAPRCPRSDPQANLRVYGAAAKLKPAEAESYMTSARALAHAVSALVRRGGSRHDKHDALRAAVGRLEGLPMQVGTSLLSRPPRVSRSLTGFLSNVIPVFPACCLL
jgi:hypothetical protein